MWPFTRGPSKAGLEGHRIVSVSGSKYVIRKVNPLLDFDAGSMPQIFSAYQSRRKKVDAPEAPPDAAKQVREMFAMVQAGVVEPKLVPVGKGELRGQEDGITVEDLFRDLDTGPKLYWEIVAHSLNRYRGVRGAIFLALTRRRLSIALRSSMAAGQATSPTAQAS